MIYPSDIAIEGARLQPDGVPWAGSATKCACCGKAVLPGDIAVRDKDRFGPNFMDGPSLAAKGSGAVCGACSAIMNAKPLIKLQSVVVSRDGAYSISKDVNRAWFLLTPPEPPWVAVVSDTTQAHLIWRTPVTVDNELMIVRMGARLLRIRRQRLLQAIDDCQVAANALVSQRAASGKRSASDASADLRHPFVALGREFDRPGQGVLRPDFIKASLGSPELLAVKRRLNELSPGELWALATLVKRKVEEPVKPEPIEIFPVA
jgi:CRISPR type IV-associated protein Csf1